MRVTGVVAVAGQVLPSGRFPMLAMLGLFARSNLDVRSP